METVTTFPSRAALAPEDAEEFSRWVAPHVGAMARLAARLAPASDRDDVVQEALVRAWEKRRQFDPSRGTPSAWLLAITADKATKARGHRPVAVRLVEVEGRPERTAEDVDVDDAVRRLSGRQRIAVDCYYFVGLSVAETAAVMRCSEGTVKSTLADARHRLRGIMGAER